MSLDPHTLRDQIAEDYQRNARRLGGDVSHEDAKRLAQSDLEIVDRYESEIRPVPPMRRYQVVEEPHQEPGPAEIEAQNVGGRFAKRAPDGDKPKVETLGNINYERRVKLIHRIFELSRKDSTGAYVYPRYARRIAELHANWTFGVKQFARVRTQRERDRIFFRRLEDLCDLSNAVAGLPAWWVK